MNLEYTIVKTCRKPALENVQTSNKMASQMNVATNNVTSQFFFVTMHQMSI